jgi:biotin synthase
MEINSNFNSPLGVRDLSSPLGVGGLAHLLQLKGEERKALLRKAAEVKASEVGNVVYLRGLIEFSNCCAKNCNYCGIRLDNKLVERYTLSNEEILTAAKYAYEKNFGSVVLQSGEIESPAFTAKVEYLLQEIKAFSNGELGVTLSCGEQSEETYSRWFAAGGHRYLLRIESSNPALYSKIHPDDEKHSFEKRIECLKLLKKIGYQVGTGVMVGLPFQTYEDLAKDLLFMQELDIDMCGMGPYIEHVDTPLYAFKDELWSLQKRFEVTQNMVAILRILMPDINIAATTALQAIDKLGREKVIRTGANILMPNITPGVYRNSYKLYDNKPCTDESADDCTSCIDVRVHLTDNEVGYGKWGDSKRFQNRG